ncbi:septum site-determining protein MinC [Alteromonas pelagimontana]|uniref:Probable septum site-determining protein MinC n=1 Tax=Alteromonas pelagimontana TaxID=1858656 RepID=A0A6M4MFK5_9ALTE|nr:septum site-determining protein MinC [Alteromonas pelagimontana]QJR81934.1 septum site-determining protein MinC [Alteromonas pelagimontana]
MAEPCFRMKGTTLTSIVLDILKFEPDEFDSQLAAKVASAPLFFTRSSLILHFNQAVTPTEFELIVTQCRRHKLQPMAVKGATEGLRETINDLGLSDISQSKATDSALQVTEPTPEKADPEEPVAPDAEQQTAQTAKVIHRPVRSGQQIYAQGGDLIILASVSEGAEILADGNIHVYGTLRGRALAGVKGDTQARIFCQHLEAELLSIAGRFVLQDTIQTQCWKQSAQAYLEEDALMITSLS